MVPSLIELQEQYGERGLTILAIDAGDEDVPTVRAFVQANKVNYINLMADAHVVQAYRLTAHPLIVFVTPAGNIFSTYLGFISKEALEREILALLAEQR